MDGRRGIASATSNASGEDVEYPSDDMRRLVEFGPVELKDGCGYQGNEFGARYPDSVCLEGYLWDADSGDACEGGWMYTNGGDLPCPQCNHAEWRAYHLDDVIEGAWVSMSERAWPFRRPRHWRDAAWLWFWQGWGVISYVWDSVRRRT